MLSQTMIARALSRESTFPSRACYAMLENQRKSFVTREHCLFPAMLCMLCYVRRSQDLASPERALSLPIALVGSADVTVTLRLKALEAVRHLVILFSSLRTVVATSVTTST